MDRPVCETQPRKEITENYGTSNKHYWNATFLICNWCQIMQNHDLTWQLTQFIFNLDLWFFFWKFVITNNTLENLTLLKLFLFYNKIHQYDKLLFWDTSKFIFFKALHLTSKTRQWATPESLTYQICSGTLHNYSTFVCNSHFNWPPLYHYQHINHCMC